MAAQVLSQVPAQTDPRIISGVGATPPPALASSPAPSLAAPPAAAAPVQAKPKSSGRPSWMPGTAQIMGKGGNSPWTNINPDVVGQTWYRVPGWNSNEGGDKSWLLWNPTYGWQTYDTVRDKYKSYGDTPVSDAEFAKWNFQKRLSPEWTRYFESYSGSHPSGAPGGGGNATPGQNGAVAPPGGGSGTDAGGNYVIDPATGEKHYLGLNPGAGGSPPNPNNPEDPMPDWNALARFGYTGPMDMNDYEKAALDFIGELAGTKYPFQTTLPAQDLYGGILGGELSPDAEKFKMGVYDSTKNEAMKTLDESQKALAEEFAQRGGYFGGKHAVAQGRLAADTGSQLAKVLADLDLSGFNKDVDTRMGAGAGLESLGRSQQSILDSILADLESGGSMITGRDTQNRADYMNASQRAYEDWLRARGETSDMFNMGLSLLGMQPFQNIVQEPQQSPWGGFLGGLGGGIGTGVGKLITPAGK